MLRDRRHLWFVLLLGYSAALAVLYPDGYQQDGGYHFLFSRWAFRHPDYLIGTWTRPLVTLVYAIPAQLGYLPAKLLTGLIVSLTGLFTFLLARDFGIRRAWLAYPFMLLQPAVMLLSFDTLTEPLFGLLLAAALWLHCRRPIAAAAVVSLLPTVRPEGLLLCLLWGFVLLADSNVDRRIAWRWPKTLILAAGCVLWWLLAWALSGDFLWLPRNWVYTGKTVYGRADLQWYARIGFEVAGLLFPLVLIGGVREWRRGNRLAAAVALYFFLFQALLWQFSLFNSAGYARYFVCVSPALALLAASGADGILERLRRPRLAIGALALFLPAAWVPAALLTDSWYSLHEARAVRESHAWHARDARHSVRRFAWSQAYMCILYDRDPQSNPLDMFQPREHNLEKLRSLEAGTLVFWDHGTGPDWYGLRAEDFEAAGFRKLRHDRRTLHTLSGRSLNREQEVFLFYKDPPP